MGRKKTKKNQKASSSANTSEHDKKKVEESTGDDIERDDDLFISENDVNLFSNFIRTTNKSFNSLGNTVVETFMSRCALGLSQALMSLYDETNPTDREDMIRRLNIIYIIFRLPEIELELRLKPQKNLNDIYNHMFNSFLYYVEKGDLPVEATLARIIVCNTVSNVEKMTAADFINKASSFKDLKVDYDGLKKWEKDNCSHFVDCYDDDIPVALMMRHAGWERKDWETGMNEAFYPISHTAPTMVPPRLPVQPEEVRIEKCRKQLMLNENMTMNNPEGNFRETVELQTKLIAAFAQYKSEIYDFKDLEARRRRGVGSDSSDDEDLPLNLPADPFYDSCHEEEETTEELRRKRQAEVQQFNNSHLQGMVDKVLIGIQLNHSQSDFMVGFVAKTVETDPHFSQILEAVKEDANVQIIIKNNVKIGSELMARILNSGTEETFIRYVNILMEIEVGVQSMEVILRLTKILRNNGNIEKYDRQPIYEFIRYCIKGSEESNNHRLIRLTSLLIMRLLKESVVFADDIFADVNPFVLKFSENTDATKLYTMITGIRSKASAQDDDQSATTASSSEPSTSEQ